MEPADFPEANKHPEDFTPEQREAFAPGIIVPTCLAEIRGGPSDGEPVSIMAWRPSVEDIQRLNHGGLIYVALYRVANPAVKVTSSFPFRL